MFFAASVLALAAAGPVAPAAAGLDRLLDSLAPLPPGPARTVAASALLLGRPYAHHPLGDGTGADRGPRLRLDGFDCQTFVETALALGAGKSAAEVAAALDDLRYQGPPSFANRNHYMMSQWVPHAIASGYLGQPAAGAATAEKEVTPQSWASRWPKDIDLPLDRRPLGHFSLPVTPLDQLLALGPSLDSGTLMLIVRADRPTFPDRVTHLGFVVQRGPQTYFRHASDVFRRVVDEPLDRFVARNRRYAYPVVGVALLPLRPGLRAAPSLAPDRAPAPTPDPAPQAAR